MRSIKWYTSPRSVLICLLPMGFAVYLLNAMPLSGLYSGFALLFAAPFALQSILTVAGLLPAVAAGGIASLGFLYSGSAQAALLSLLYLMLPLAAYIVCLHLQVDWRHSMQALALTFAGTVLLIYLLLRRMVAPELFEYLSQAAIKALDAMPERDYVLDTFYRFGLLSLPEQIAQSPLTEAAGGGYTYSAEALQEFYRQVSARVDLWLRSLLPTLVCSVSIWYAVAGSFVSHTLGRKHAQRLAFRRNDESRQDDYFTGLRLPEFSLWFIPKQLGFVLMGMGVLSLVTRLSGGGRVALAGQMLYMVFAALFGIQGLSLVNHLQKRQNVRPGMRVFTMLVIMAVISQATVLIGLFDQLSDPRKLRKPPEEDSDTRRTDL